jgi:hypothetical protein
LAIRFIFYLAEPVWGHEDMQMRSASILKAGRQQSAVSLAAICCRADLSMRFSCDIGVASPDDGFCSIEADF